MDSFTLPLPTPPNWVQSLEFEYWTVQDVENLNTRYDIAFPINGDYHTALTGVL